MSNSKKSIKPALVIMKRELGTYFSSPIAYIVTGLFLIISGIMFFTAFYLQNRASLRNLFSLFPILLSFFIPALTMRLFAEEKKSGSIETLYTLPVTEFDVVLGKYLAALIASSAMIAPTLFYLIHLDFLMQVRLSVVTLEQFFFAQPSLRSDFLLHRLQKIRLSPFSQDL